VAVDTQPPVIVLQALPPRDGQVGVEWDIREENLDLQRLRLDYRSSNTADWQPLPISAAGRGSYYWRPSAGGALEVRMHAVDRAGNNADNKTNVVTPGVNGGQNNPHVPSTPARANVRIVNSKKISLHFEVKDQGPSGVSAIEVWNTQDGRNWQKYREYTANTKPPLFVDVSDEGTYGLTLVVRSGVGLGERPPQVGDPPQLWVEVDLTRPVVRLLDVDVGRSADAGNLTVTWSATDKNLGDNPISLFYADTPDAQVWEPVARNLANTGRYVWKMHPKVPFKFYLRVEAADRAGNVASDQTRQTVIVDLAVPKVIHLEVSPVK
jgi:hypothetical protein